MIIEKNIKVGIVSGVIATFLFIYFLDPFFKIVGYLIFNLFSSISRSYIDRLFEQSALMVGPDPSLFVLTLILFLFDFAAIWITVALFNARKKPIPPRESRILNYLRSILKPRIHLIFLAITSVLIILSILSVYNTMFQLRFVSSFNQHIITIEPFASDQEIKIIRSRWTQMKSEADYTMIYKDIKNIADKNGVQLSENKIFILDSY